MKALLFAASALILNTVYSAQVAAHPPAYGPDGLIPHSHTGDGTTITGSVVMASHNDCPEVTLSAALGVQPEGPCIRVNHGRPISHHVSAPEGEPVLIPTSRPFIAAPSAPTILAPTMAVPVKLQHSIIRPVIRQAAVPIIPLVRQPVPMPVVAQPIAVPSIVAATPRVLIQGPVQAAVVGPELVTQFHHDGELLTVFNTHTSGMFGMTLMKIVNQRGQTETNWWTSRGRCFTRMAFLSQACWSTAGYHERFESELQRIRRVIDGPGTKRSTDPCDHYTRLEAILSGDDSGYCGY